MIEKNSTKHHYLKKKKKKGFYGHLNTEDIAADADYFKKQFKKIGRIPCFVCLKPYIIVN